MLDAAQTAAVLDEVARGNRDAFRQVVRAHGLTVRSYLASQLHNLADVDDLAQDVFLAAFRGLGAFRRSIGLDA